MFFSSLQEYNKKLTNSQKKVLTVGQFCGILLTVKMTNGHK